MNKPTTLRLGTKIIIGFICISLLLAVVGFISDYFTSEIRKEQLQSVNEGAEVVVYTGDMERSLFQSLVFLNGIREAVSKEQDYGTVQELPAAKDLVNNFEQELDKFEISFSNLEDLLGDNERLPEDINELNNSYEVYKSISREWLTLGVESREQSNLMFINSIEPYFRNNIIPKITQLRNYVLTIQQQRNQYLESSLQQAAIINYVATIFSVLLAIILAIYIYRSIANPLSKLSQSAKKIGEGDLGERIEIDSEDELGELAKAFNNMAAGLQKSTVSKAYLDNIIESIQDALFVADDDRKIVRVNSAAANMTGYSSEEMIGQPLADFYSTIKVDEPKNSKKDSPFESTLIRKNQSTLPVLLSEAGLVDNQGKKVGTVAVASDITDMIKAEKKIRASLKEKEVMLAEIHHRVKNNLAVISGILQLQGLSVENKDVKKALNDSQMRIQSIALVHEMLYESESLAFIKYDNYIRDLLQAIGSMHLNEGKNIKLVADVAPMSLSINQAIPCSLLVNELVVNAFKHAFKDREEGKVKVQAHKKNEKAILIVSDNGDGFDEEKFSESDSLGVTLIKTLTKQLGGTFEIENSSDSGSSFKITFTVES